MSIIGAQWLADEGRSRAATSSPARTLRSRSAAVTERATGQLAVKAPHQRPLADSARAALVNVAQNVLSPASMPARGNAHPNLVPYQLLEAADRPFVIAVGSDAANGARARMRSAWRISPTTILCEPTRDAWNTVTMWCLPSLIA